MESVGFRNEGTQREFYLKDGELIDNLLFGLLRSEVDLVELDRWCQIFPAHR